MHGPCPAESDQGELPRVIAPLHRDQPHGAHHARVGDLDHPVGVPHDIQPQGRPHLCLQGRAGGWGIEP